MTKEYDNRNGDCYERCNNINLYEYVEHAMTVCLMLTIVCCLPAGLR